MLSSQAMQKDCPFYAFINHDASCFLDSVIVALFVPLYGGYFDRNFLEQPPVQPDGHEAAWEQAHASPEWRLALQTELRHQVALLRGEQSEVAGWPCIPLRRVLEECPLTSVNPDGEPVHVNFGDNQQQSAVDFFRYLLAVFRVRDNVVVFQRSITLMRRRAATVAANGDLHILSAIWNEHASSARKWDSTNAEHLMDPSERNAILQDVTGWTVMLENKAGDRRRIGCAESGTIFPCQMTLEDKAQASVPIERELVPHVETVGGNGYTGDLCAKINAVRLLQVPVLIFEVSRKVMVFQGGRVQHTKVQTRVDYGDIYGQEYVLGVHNQMYALEAVICHIGNAHGGHYVAFVQEEASSGEKQWFFYDDFSSGKLVPLDVTQIETHHGAPSMYGELFLYTPLTRDM
jgi:hypothetical protein